MNIATVNCPSCGSDGISDLRSYRCPEDSGPFRGMSVARCSLCDLCFAYPVPSEKELEAYYSSQYWVDMHPKDWVKSRVYAWRQRDHARAQLKFVSEFVDPVLLDGVVDIGAGFGHFLSEVRMQGGRSLVAVEPSPDPAALLSKSGLDVVPFGWEDERLSEWVSSHRQRVALVSASHVLEHSRSPKEFVDKVCDVLAPGGHFFCEVPHDFVTVLMSTPEVRADDSPHLLFFSRDSLRYLLERAGLSVIGMQTFGNALPVEEVEPERVVMTAKRVLPNSVQTLLSNLHSLQVYAAYRVAPTSTRASWRSDRTGPWLRAMARKMS